MRSNGRAFQRPFLANLTRRCVSVRRGLRVSTRDHFGWTLVKKTLGSARALACRVRRLAERTKVPGDIRCSNPRATMFAARASRTAREARALPRSCERESKNVVEDSLSRHVTLPE